MKQAQQQQAGTSATHGIQGMSSGEAEMLVHRLSSSEAVMLVHSLLRAAQALHSLPAIKGRKRQKRHNKRHNKRPEPAAPGNISIYVYIYICTYVYEGLGARGWACFCPLQ